jgi:YidC/Oxa1 family membrane protein insertase
MDKRTLLAVVLSVIVITIGFTIQTLMFPPVVPETTDQHTRAVEQVTVPEPTTAPMAQAPQPTPSQTVGGIVALGQDPANTSPIIFTDNQTFRATIDPRGGVLRSFELLNHRDGDQPVNMILPDGSDTYGLRMVFGQWDGQEITAVFNRETSNRANEIRLTRDFAQQGREESPFRVTLVYTFQPGEYMFELRVSVTDINRGIPFINTNDRAYSIVVGPQIGPFFDPSRPGNARNADFRRFLGFAENRRTVFSRSNPGNPEVLTNRFSWTAIDGKYFSFVAVPGNANFTTVFANTLSSQGTAGNTMALERAPIASSSQEDIFRFYAGPKRDANLRVYNRASDNQFGIANLRLDELVDSNFLGWLENILKQGLELFYLIIPNWGIAIILLTIVVKLLFYPLTKKSHESTHKMQALAPKMKEIQEKYKDNPQKMNAMVAEMYRKEGVNPLGGCLPILIQFPFFIAMYGLFNNHFDLRGASFIPGWITDLSSPDVVLEFGFTIPLLGWTQLHLLPFVYLASQLFYGKVTQQPNAAAQAGSQKMMLYMLPIVFFFVLYSVPSGLLVYWISQNIITMLQQLWVNRHDRFGKKA